MTRIRIRNPPIDPDELHVWLLELTDAVNNNTVDVFSGEDAPSNDLGVDDDIYERTDGTTFIKVSGAWQ